MLYFRIPPEKPGKDLSTQQCSLVSPSAHLLRDWFSGKLVNMKIKTVSDLKYVTV